MFVTELRRLSEYCEFAATLYEMLRDSLVCRVRDSRIQRCLLVEPKLSLKRELDLAVALETAEKDALNLQKNPTPGGNPTVNKFKGKAGDEKEAKPSQTSKCSPCDGKHNSSECRFKDAKCHACGKVGHVSRACRSKKKGTHKPTQKERGQRLYKPQSTNRLEGEREGVEEDCTIGTYSMFSFGSMCSSPYININGKPLNMEIDTGASLSVISEKIYQELWEEGGQPSLVKKGVVLRTYTGE